MVYAALIMDIKNSRGISEKERLSVQLKIKTIIELLNSVFSRHLKYEVVFSSGDSVQGLFFQPSYALDYYYFFKALLYPYTVRCGIGTDSILETDSELLNTSNMQDGPAYHKAREALEISKIRDFSILFSSKIKYNMFVNEYFSVIRLLEEKMKPKQQDVWHLVSLLCPLLLPDLNMDLYYHELPRFIPKNVVNYQNVILIDLSFVFSFWESIFQYLNFDLIIDRNSIAPAISYYISEILGTTRENIRQMMLSGNMNDVRNLQALSLQFIHKFFDEVKS